MIPFVEYEVGRRKGKYQAQIPGTPRSQSHFLARIFAKIAEEVENQIAKYIAMGICQDLYANQVPFNDLKALAKLYLVKKFFLDFSRNQYDKLLQCFAFIISLFNH